MEGLKCSKSGSCNAKNKEADVNHFKINAQRGGSSFYANPPLAENLGAILQIYQLTNNWCNQRDI